MVHIPLLKAMRGVAVTAVADASRAELERARRLVPLARCHTSVEQILSNPALDAVIVALPSSLHARTAVTAFDSGLSVYLEKPVALNLTDGAGVLAAWRKAGKAGAVGHNLRFNPLFERLVSEVRESSCGKVQKIRTAFHIPAPSRSSWRMDPGEGGVLFDLATHHIDLLHVLLGESVTQVSTAILSTSHVKLELQFASGVHAEIECTHSPRFSNWITIETSARRLRIDFARSWNVDVMEKGTSRRRTSGISGVLHLVRKLRAPMREPSFSRALTAFVRSVRTGAPCSPDIADGVRSLAVAAAAAQSRSGLPITVEYPVELAEH